MVEQTNNEATPRPAILGLDLGSYVIRLGLVDASNQVIGFRREAYTEDSRLSGRALADQVRRVIARTLAERLDSGSGQNSHPNTAGIAGIGIAVPGLIDVATGRIRRMSHLPEMAEIDLRAELEREFGVPVRIENNARAAATAELNLGVARGTSNFLYLHLGANVSAGIFLEGRLLRGKSGLAGAIGRTSIYVEHLATSLPLEELVSADNIVRRTRLRLERDKTSTLSRLASGGGFNYDDIIDCAHNGDDLSRLMIDRTGIFIAIAISDIISLLNLSLVAIGGAVAARQFLVEAISREVGNRTHEILRDDCRVAAATLGIEATVLGMGMLLQADAPNPNSSNSI